MSGPIETIRIGMMAGGDTEYVARVKRLLSMWQASGDVRIISMDDETAKIELINKAWARTFGGDGGAAWRP